VLVAQRTDRVDLPRLPTLSGSSGRLYRSDEVGAAVSCWLSPGLSFDPKGAT